MTAHDLIAKLARPEVPDALIAQANTLIDEVLRWQNEGLHAESEVLLDHAERLLDDAEWEDAA